MRKTHAFALIAMAILLCGCGRQESVPEQPVQTSATAGTTLTTLPETTTELTTTTTTNVYTPPSSPSLTSRLNAMSLREKVSQMILACCSDEGSADFAAANGAGGLCLFAPPFEGKTQWGVQQMIHRFQSEATYPMLVAVDEEGGTVNRVSINPQIRPVPFSSPRYLLETGGTEALIDETREKTHLLAMLGINCNLAPVCDVPMNDTDYIAARCFSLDPNEAAENAAIVVSTMKRNGIGSTLKHFPGYGGSGDTHKNMAYDARDYSAFTEGDFLPFAAGIRAGADSVMVSHNIVQCMDPDSPASLSPEVHRILREELGFTGVIISDDLGMNAITQFTGGQNPAIAAVLAGNDLLCYADFNGAADALERAAQNGIISMDKIDASVLRILAWKQSLGLI
ncbi:MAG TPA: beta-hexosaminidase [Ruminococcus sp.]|nr:beta-hexosaminidase [Ruminococcus sp.]